jgi:hypothetical protein
MAKTSLRRRAEMRCEMEDSKQFSTAGGTQAMQVELRNGLEEQQRVLDRLSRELDDYFSQKRFGEMK